MKQISKKELDIILKKHHKFGTVRIDNGYYRVSSIKEGNRDKLVHRLVVKPLLDYLSSRYPEIKWEVHHKNENKLDNRFENLQIIPKEVHRRIHGKNKHTFKGRNHSKKTLNKIRTSLRGKGLFGATCSFFIKSKNPEKRCWNSIINIKGNRKSLGVYEDFISSTIVHDLVLKEVGG